ncbi:hypothetical protein NL493_30700, partial [Klebsiella pneumoniae]|nr:hypothetical protein [Klebsiella pneumoniae]
GDVAIYSDQKVGERASECLVQAVPKRKKNKGKKRLDPSQSTAPKVPKKAKTWMPEVQDQKADVSAWKDLFVPKAVLR